EDVVVDNRELLDEVIHTRQALGEPEVTPQLVVGDGHDATGSMPAKVDWHPVGLAMRECSLYPFPGRPHTPLPMLRLLLFLPQGTDRPARVQAGAARMQDLTW